MIYLICEYGKVKGHYEFQVWGCEICFEKKKGKIELVKWWNNSWNKSWKKEREKKVVWIITTKNETWWQIHRVEIALEFHVVTLLFSCWKVHSYESLSNSYPKIDHFTS